MLSSSPLFIPSFKKWIFSEQLLLTNPSDWWKSVEGGYQFLKNEGYQTIAVIGVSLGGILALNVGQKLNVNGIVTMSVPYKRDVDMLKSRVLKYALTYKQLEGKGKEQISHELDHLKASSFNSLLQFKEYIDLTMEGLSNMELMFFQKSVMYYMHKASSWRKPSYMNLLPSLRAMSLPLGIV